MTYDHNDSQESGGKCSDMTKRLASFKCEANAARDFHRWVKLPLDPLLHVVGLQDT